MQENRLDLTSLTIGVGLAWGLKLTIFSESGHVTYQIGGNK